jgi:hypothetical protein
MKEICCQHFQDKEKKEIGKTFLSKNEFLHQLKVVKKERKEL